MNELYNNLNPSVSESVQIIGVGKSQYSNANNNWISTNQLPFTMDQSPSHETWNEWEANQRDLYFIDRYGNFNCKINISSGFNVNAINEKIQTLIYHSTPNLIITDLLATPSYWEPGSLINISGLLVNDMPWDFNAYPGTQISSNSPYINFGENAENWFYAIFANESYEIGWTIQIPENIPAGFGDIDITIMPSTLHCSDECNSCLSDCYECPDSGHMTITLSESNGCANVPYDVVEDCQTNIVDVVRVINIALGTYEPDDYEFSTADANDDNIVNVVDIILIVNYILYE